MQAALFRTIKGAGHDGNVFIHDGHRIFNNWDILKHLEQYYEVRVTHCLAAATRPRT